MLAHGEEDGIGKSAGDDAEDDFGDCGADGLSGDFLAEHGGDLLDDGVPDGLGESFVGGLVDEGGAAGDVEHGAEIAEGAELGLAIKRVVLAGEGCIGARMTSRCL